MEGPVIRFDSNDWMIAIPDRDYRVVSKVSKTQVDLIQELGREPTVSEFAIRFNIPVPEAGRAHIW